MKSWIFISVLYLVIGIPLQAQAMQGGYGHGGSNGCLGPNGQFQLAELTKQSDFFSRAQADQLRTQRLPLLKVETSSLESYVLAQQRLALHTHENKLAYKIFKSVQNLSVYSVSKKFRPALLDLDGDPHECLSPKESIGLYLSGHFFLLSTPQFNRLDLESQTCMWIHEGIRQLQMHGRLGHLKTSQIEKLTAILCKQHLTTEDKENIHLIMSEDKEIKFRNWLNEISELVCPLDPLTVKLRNADVDPFELRKIKKLGQDLCLRLEKEGAAFEVKSNQQIAYQLMDVNLRAYRSLPETDVRRQHLKDIHDEINRVVAGLALQALNSAAYNVHQAGLNLYNGLTMDQIASEEFWKNGSNERKQKVTEALRGVLRD